MMFPIKMFRKILTERGERTFRFSVHLTECGICFVPLRAASGLSGRAPPRNIQVLDERHANSRSARMTLNPPADGLIKDHG